MSCVRAEARSFTKRVGNRHRIFLRRAIEPAVAAAFDVDLGDLCSATRGSPRAAFARQVAMYLAHVTLGASLTEIGNLFERDRTTVAHACALVEDRRDDPALDAQLSYLEEAVAAMRNAVALAGGVR